MELKIYNQSGELKLTVSTSSSSTWNTELMVENAVSASFTHPFYVPLDVNDYVMLAGIKFSINKEYKPKQKSTQEYAYSVKFYGPEHDAERVMYLNLTDGQYDVQFSLDGSPREHLKKWVDNMNRIYGREVWSIGDVAVAPNQTIEYNNLSCWDALASMAEAFETEWWADGFTMNLSRCERGEHVFLGYMQGLTSLTQSENSNDVKFFTRLIPLGSTKNIARSRYGYSRLQLPDKSTYVDRNTQYGLYEYVEEAAFAEIFPHYTGTVTEVRTEEKTGEDGKPFIVYYFADAGMTFDPSDNEIGGLVKQVSFQTGDLTGRDFEANYNSTTKEWEIINTYPSDDVQIPGGNLIPRVGDMYIPWNFRMPVEYETQAELDYKAAVDDYLAKYSEDVSKYGGDTDYIYIDKNSVPLVLGQNVRLLSDEYFGEVGYRDSRMTKVVRKLDNLSVATIECSNQVGKGWKTQVDNSINELKYVINEKVAQMFIEVLKTWDMKEPSNYNVFSSLRSRAEFLSKKYPDETRYLMKFLSGLECGEFSQGSTGVGIYKDDAGNWHIETDYLDVRMKFTAKEVEIQKVFHIGGSEIKSSASMKCIRVEELDDVYRCYMNTSDGDGQVIYNQFKVNDQAYVQTFNLERQADGTLGNHFFWRLVTAVGPDYIDLSKAVCALASDAPKAFDDIVQLGYRGTDDPSRQVAVIDAGAGEGAPYYRQYVGINSFHLPEPETQLKPGDNKLSGVFHIQPGTTGWQNAEGLPEEIQAAVSAANAAQNAADGVVEQINGLEYGKSNMLRNSGFTGDYLSKNLENDTDLNYTSEMYSPSLQHWDVVNAIAQNSSVSQSGKEAVLTSGSMVQTLYYKMMAGENYIFSFRGKGSLLTFSCGGYSETVVLSSDYERYVKHFKTVSSGTTFSITVATGTICELQLERGTIVSTWGPSMVDNTSELAYYQNLQYIASAIKDGSVDMLGGLILANMLQLGNYKDGAMQKVTAGVSGVYNDDDDVAYWAGGSLEKAIRAVMLFKDNPDYEPTEDELQGLAKAVITHGGRAILNDVVLRGYIYALGGFFRGTVHAEDGEFNGKIAIANGKIILDKDGSGKLANGNIEWDADGNVSVRGKYESKIGGSRILIDPGDNYLSLGPSITFYDKNDKLLMNIFGLSAMGWTDPRIEMRDPNDEYKSAEYRLSSMVINERTDSGNFQTYMEAGRIYIAKNGIIVWDINKR